MTAETLAALIGSSAVPAIVDVRSQREFDAGHVPGAVHIPFWRIAMEDERLALAKDAPLVLYCGHGPRAHLAGAALRRLGYSRIAYLQGHMKRWRELNLPLERTS